MPTIQSNRIQSIDILRGLIMVTMALDHVRDYFNYGSFYGDPTDLATTTPILFFTRFVTHFCAPIFIFLAGTSAYLYGTKKSKRELSRFLWTRGLWLIFLELVVNNFIWTFDFTYSFHLFQVIWAIGFCMVCLSLLIYLPNKVLLFLGILLVALHNLLDSFVLTGNTPGAILWYLLHQDQMLIFSNDSLVFLHYPLIPLIGLMTLGYLFGSLYTTDFPASIRKLWLSRIGLGLITLFFVLRGINIYGELVPWAFQKSASLTLLSFFNVTKYPMSLLYLCITIGPALLFLYFMEDAKNRLTDFFLVYGRVPLFYYFLHTLVIHLLAITGILLFGGEWHDMILTSKEFLGEDLKAYGYSLWVVYALWIGVVVFLYPFCKMYMDYKSNNKDKWWLSYL